MSENVNENLASGTASEGKKPSTNNAKCRFPNYMDSVFEHLPVNIQKQLISISDAYGK